MMLHGPVDPRTERLYQMTRWLRGLGCCGSCALWWALAAVAKEWNESPPGERQKCCASLHRRDLCDGYAKARWTDRPKRPDEPARMNNPRVEAMTGGSRNGPGVDPRRAGGTLPARVATGNIDQRAPSARDRARAELDHAER